MTTVLHLGVLDVPYSEDKATTGDVAQILEDKYGIMNFFVQTVGAENITNALAHSAQQAVEDMFSGAPTTKEMLTVEATEEIEGAFRVFLDQREMDGKVPGVPTQAALKGVSHRKKRPYVKSNPERSSFIDTGLYEASMKAWVSD